VTLDDTRDAMRGCRRLLGDLEETCDGGRHRNRDAASGPPPPPQGRKVGDTVIASDIRWLGKYAIDEPSSGFQAASFRLMNYPRITGKSAESYADYYVDCPPTDEGFVAELDKVIAAPRPISIKAKLEITEVLNESTNWSSYRAKLIDFWATHDLTRTS
jgi:hypothetical protein